ncbi:unnamed protein product, partial [Rotaria sp. Silwood2]
MNDTSLHVYNLALSNQSGTVPLLRCDRGIEHCGLTIETGVTDMKKYLLVNTTTLDAFVQANAIQDMIDVLKIDTEGFDPLVLKGAQLILKRQQVRLLIFEHHDIGAWKNMHLRD